MTTTFIEENLLDQKNIETKIIFGWGKSLSLREYINTMIDELFDFFYLEEEIFILAAEPVN